MTPRKTLVFGPAYLDRVLKVDAPLVDPAVGGVLDRSVPGRVLGPSPGVSRPGAGRLLIRSVPDFDLEIELPPGWPGPEGVIGDGEVSEERPRRVVRGIAWHDDLGGMGAGFARAFGGVLTWVAGQEGDATSGAVAGLLDRNAVAHRPIHVPGRFGEWTLLVTSGEFGDKLAVGIRNPRDVDVSFAPIRDEPCDLLVAASMTNARAASALAGANARVRMFAPARRNMVDPEPRVGQFARHIDILCCNRDEWETLPDREEVAWRLSILAVTDGPRGAEIRYTTPTGDAGLLSVTAFPRREPPKDTNRAGEAFASALVATLLDAGWSPGTTPDDLIRRAAERAAVAAALVLDRVDFGFPTAEEIDRALAAGMV